MVRKELCSVTNGSLALRERPGESRVQSPESMATSHPQVRSPPWGLRQTAAPRLRRPSYGAVRPDGSRPKHRHVPPLGMVVKRDPAVPNVPRDAIYTMGPLTTPARGPRRKRGPRRSSRGTMDAVYTLGRRASRQAMLGLEHEMPLKDAAWHVLASRRSRGLVDLE
ncbi:hypothetical protein LX36DRAFT_279435 [Colletotrichum falcatum]|nr:hypothetical protein LX36DRAFT_279435 [Colletotrichum falcatum]